MAAHLISATEPCPPSPCAGAQRPGWFVHCCVVPALLTMAVLADAAPVAYLAYLADNTISVLDIADYRTVATLSLGANLRRPAAIAAHAASGKILIGESGGVTVIDAGTHAILAQIPIAPSLRGIDSGAGVTALAVAPEGRKAYALSSGMLSVIDLATCSLTAEIAIDPSTGGIAIDPGGHRVYLAHSGLEGGMAGLTIIDTATDTIEAVLPSGGVAPDFRPRTVAVNPAGDRVYVLGSGGLSYLMLDRAGQRMTEVVPVIPDDTPPIFSFTRIAFNRDGSRFFLGGTSGGTASLPVFEIDAATHTVSRVLLLASGFADSHTVADLFTNFSDGKFVLGISVREQMSNYAYQPPRRLLFVDGMSGGILADLGYASDAGNDFISGTMLDK